jgi:uncharacterized protein YcnI
VRRATIASLAAAVLAVFSYAPAAWAHAEFEGTASVPAGSDQAVTLHVPEERGRHVHNAKVMVEVPTGFTVISCQAKPEWECTTGSSPTGAGLVTFTRTSGTSDDPLFSYSVHTPAQPGDYAFKVSQTYSDGKVVIWDGPETSDTPSPVLKVTAAAAAPSPAPAPPPAAPVAPTPAPAPASPAPVPEAAPRPAASAPEPVAAASPAPQATPAARTEAHLKAAEGLPRTGPDRTLLILAGAAFVVGGFGVAGGRRNTSHRS